MSLAFFWGQGVQVHAEGQVGLMHWPPSRQLTEQLQALEQLRVPPHEPVPQLTVQGVFLVALPQSMLPLQALGPLQCR